MSGSGRKSQYRKSVTTAFLNDSLEPTENEQIAIVVCNRGSNLFEIKMPDGCLELARLPNKFNKLIWVKKNDYLIVEKNDGESDASNSSKVKYAINNIINKGNIKKLTTRGLWPSEFCVESVDVRDNELMPGYEESDC